jgi:hypothetical protein
MVIIKKARRATTRPIMDAMIVFRADSTFDLSPPEVIHLIPPQIRKNNAIKAAAIKRMVTTDEITDPMLLAVSVQRTLKFVPPPEPFGHGLTGTWAKAGKARLKNVAIDAAVPVIVAKSFFMSCIDNRILFLYLSIPQELCELKEINFEEVSNGIDDKE